MTSPRRALHRLGYLGLVLLGGCPGGEPAAPVVDLRLVPDTIIVPPGDITGAAWLGDRRWVVLAPLDRAVLQLDFERRAAQPFGKTKAFRQPSFLFRAGDSVYLTDWMLRRTTTWSLDGRLVDSLGAVNQLRGALPRARDGEGRWYFESRPPAGPDGSGNRDSGAVIRAGAGLERFDTVARLAPFDLADVVANGQRRQERRLLSGEDRWGVTEDGWVWVARVGPNRVDWRVPEGRTIHGPQLPDRVLTVNQADRDLFLQRFEPDLRSTVEQIPFAAIKPPFDAALNMPGTRGGVWLVKSRSIGDSLRYNHVVDSTGHLLEVVRHVGHGRVLAVAPSRVLVGEPFPGGTRLLEFLIP